MSICLTVPIAEPSSVTSSLPPGAELAHSNVANAPSRPRSSPTSGLLPERMKPVAFELVRDDLP